MLGGDSCGSGPKLADSGKCALSPQAENNKALPVRMTTATLELAAACHRPPPQLWQNSHHARAGSIVQPC